MTIQGVIAYYLLFGHTPFSEYRAGEEFFRAVIIGKFTFDPDVPVSQEGISPIFLSSYKYLSTRFHQEIDGDRSK